MQNRITKIQQRLKDAFSPHQLEVIDDSAQHVGHHGAEGGAGHYTVKIAADCFNGLSRVESHRKVYTVLNDLIPHEIHALKITIIS